MELTKKYKAFMEHEAQFEFLEGTTYAGKTTVSILKFMARVAENGRRVHVLSGLDLGVIEKNIINKENGVLDVFGEAVYHANGGGGHTLPHILYGGKLIYVLGYGDKARWKKALGGQYGCVYIDEINIADMDYVREISIRCDYLLATLNPDDPELPVYAEYVNHSRPLAEWVKDMPEELLGQLDQSAKEGWTHWYFSFEHNAALTAEKRRQICENVPLGTKLYRNKVLGLRGRSTGLVFNLDSKSIIDYQRAKGFKYKFFTCGVDSSYSRRTNDVFAFIFTGFTECRRKITLAEQTFNNKDLAVPVSPSDIPLLLVAFLDKQKNDWGYARDVFIDSADQATITECNKYKRHNICGYQFGAAFKKLSVLDRITLEQGWLQHGVSYVLDSCKEYIREMNIYSWSTQIGFKNQPEDRNDHTINAHQYSWLPYAGMVGG